MQNRLEVPPEYCLRHLVNMGHFPSRDQSYLKKSTAEIFIRLFILGEGGGNRDARNHNHSVDITKIESSI